MVSSEGVSIRRPTPTLPASDATSYENSYELCTAYPVVLTVVADDQRRTTNDEGFALINFSLTPAVSIRTEALCRHYQMGSATIRAVDGVTVQIHTGEFVA